MDEMPRVKDALTCNRMKKGAGVPEKLALSRHELQKSDERKNGGVERNVSFQPHGNRTRHARHRFLDSIPSA
jgi:hypothetical protein